MQILTERPAFTSRTEPSALPARLRSAIFVIALRLRQEFAQVRRKAKARRDLRITLRAMRHLSPSLRLDVGLEDHNVHQLFESTNER